MSNEVTTSTTDLIRRYMTIPAVMDVLRRKQLPILSPETWDDRNDRYFMELYKAHRKASGLYGLCAATCPETYHHWKVFTGGSAGACLVLKRRPLEQYLDRVRMPEVTSVRFEEVEYLELSEVKEITPGDIDRLPFLKRVGFADEAEYRVVVETNTPQQTAVLIDCPIDRIERIYLNPWLPETQAQSVIAILKEIEGCKRLDIRRSFLIDSGTWKRAGDKAAGEKAPRRIKLTAKSSQPSVGSGSATPKVKPAPNKGKRSHAKD